MKLPILMLILWSSTANVWCIMPDTTFNHRYRETEPTVWCSIDMDEDGIVDTIYVSLKVLEVKAARLSAEKLPTEIHWGRAKGDTVTEVSTFDISFSDSGKVHTSIYDANHDGIPDIVVHKREYVKEKKAENLTSFAIIGGRSLRTTDVKNIGHAKALADIEGVEKLPEDAKELMVPLGSSGLVLRKRQTLPSFKKTAEFAVPKSEIISDDYSVWPTPTAGLVNIKYLYKVHSENLENRIQIRILNAEGRLLLEKSMILNSSNSYSAAIELSNISMGSVYLAISSDGKMVHFQKLLIVR